MSKRIIVVNSMTNKVSVENSKIKNNENPERAMLDRAVIQEIGRIESEIDDIRQRLFKVQDATPSVGSKAQYDKARHLLFEASNCLGTIR